MANRLRPARWRPDPRHSHDADASDQLRGGFRSLLEKHRSLAASAIGAQQIQVADAEGKCAGRVGLGHLELGAQMGRSGRRDAGSADHRALSGRAGQAFFADPMRRRPPGCRTNVPQPSGRDGRTGLYREDDNSGVGNRLLHLTFCWAKEKGFSTIDIGGGHDYKRKFAPQIAERHEFTIATPARYFAQRAVNGVRWRMQRLRGAT